LERLCSCLMRFSFRLIRSIFEK